MEQKKKILSIMLVFVLTFMMLLNGISVQAAEKQAVIPRVDYVTAPVLEYTAGDIVNFNLHSPNYGGRVQYRVILWDNNRKEARDLWTTGDRYYTGWIPYGNNNFNLHWRIDEPGSYRITVYVKRAGITNNKTALKGYNCDSYMESKAFSVKSIAAVFDKEGQTYGSADANKVEAYNNDIEITAKNVAFNNASIEGSLTITGDNAVIRNVNISGELVIDPGKEGSCIMENITARAIKVLSGGQNSIHIKDSSIGTMDVNSQNAVRIEVDGDTEIVSTSASGYVIFDRKNGTYGTITITKAENGQSVVEFRGDIKDKVVVETTATIKTGQNSSIANVVVNTQSNTDIVKLDGQFGKVEISSGMNQGEGSNAKLEVAANSKIENIIANNDTVINLDRTASIVNVEKKDNEVIINGESNAGNGGEYVPPSIAVTAISVTGAGAAAEVVNGLTLQMSAAIIPANATNKTITWSITNGTGSAAINANGLLTAMGAGTVTVNAKNPASNVTGSLVVTITEPDKTTLSSAINAEYTDGAARISRSLAETDYTEVSWMAYADALTAAIAVEADLNAKQQEVSDAAAAIAAAKDSLVFAGKAGLDAAKAAANGKTEAEYTPISWSNLTAALALPETTNAEVVKKTTDINIAIGLLVKRGDKTALTAAINAEYTDGAVRVARAKAEADYSLASWNVYSNAITAAIAVEGDANAVQKQVDDAAAAIGTAKGKLVFAGIADLEAARKEANAKNQAEYTTVSWSEFIHAVIKAFELSETTNTEVVKKTTDINNAVGLLVKRGDKTALTAAINLEYTDGAARTERSLAETDYTEVSWKPYADAVTAAIAVEGDIDAVQLQVDNAAAAIGTAKVNLIFAGKAGLDAAKTVASGKAEADYTSSSWSSLAAALALPETKNGEVVDKTTAINSAINNLVFAGKADLDAAKTAASEKAEADYTTDSWIAFISAMSTANEITETTNAKVMEKSAAINTAISKLIFAGKADLDAAKAAANGKTEAEYTPTSWSNLAAALALPETTNGEVVKKTNDINSAIGLLVKRGDKTALTAAINAEYTDGAARLAWALAGSDYTSASWNAYTNVITAAITLEGNANATQQQVDNAAAAIGTTKAALVFANKAALDAAVAVLGTIKEEKYYTASSWAAFASAKNAALAMKETTNSEMGAKAEALNNARALLVEKVAEILNSIEITNFNYETIYATQARIESKVITTSNFGPGNNKSFTVTDSSGNSIPINLSYNIPALVNDQPATYAAVVGSAVESFIQQYFVDKGGSAGLSSRTLWASGSGDKFSIGAFGEGPTGKITITGPDASYFFDTLQATGTGDDYSRNRTFTVSDGTNTATITLNSSYTNMTNLVNRINSMLGATKAVAVKIDESHFKLVAKEVWIQLTIGGANKADFFSSFISQ